MTAYAANTPPRGWEHAMTASGRLTHLVDPSAYDDRLALCGVGPVYPSPRPLERDPLAVDGLCARCRTAADRWTADGDGDVPVPAGPDPLLPLLRAAGLSEPNASAAAAIARGYLSSEHVSALARAQVTAAGALEGANQVAASVAHACGRPPGATHPAAAIWRGVATGLTWSRDVVHARRTWPPQPDPPRPPLGYESGA